MRLLFAFVLLAATLVNAAAPSAQHDFIHGLVGLTRSDAHVAVSTLASGGGFGNITGVSQACIDSINKLSNNADIAAKYNAVTVSGCKDINFADQNICKQTDTSISCTCISTFGNDQPLKDAVAAQGGKVCPITLDLSVSFSANGRTGTVSEKVTFPFLATFGSACTNADIQATLDYLEGTARQGFNQGFAQAGGNNNGITVNSLSVKVSACGVNNKNASRMVTMSVMLMAALMALIALLQ